MILSIPPRRSLWRARRGEGEEEREKDVEEEKQCYGVGWRHLIDRIEVEGGDGRG